MLTNPLHVHQCWSVDEVRQVNLSKEPQSYFDYVTPFLGTFQWAPVDSQWDLNISSWALNSTSFLYLTAFIPHSVYLHLTLGYSLQPKKYVTAQVNKPQASLQNLRFRWKKKNGLDKRNGGLYYTLYGWPTLGKLCSILEMMLSKGFRKTGGYPEEKLHLVRG